jgi:hypothetical protein
MDRTKKLLMSVTASALLTGGAVANPNVSELTATTNREAPEFDPQDQADRAILSVLRTVEREQALTLDEIIARATSLNRNSAEFSLRRLLIQKKVERTGSQPPFRYYNPQAAEIRKTNEAQSIITGILRGVAVENALSLDQILAKRPDLERGIAEKVVKTLVTNGEVRRTGDNTSSRPYRYYDRVRNGYGG